MGILGVTGLSAGCGHVPRAPVVIFLDGAGGFGYGDFVRRGLRQAGFKGEFDTHPWSSFMVPADHLLLARVGLLGRPLADKIVRVRRKYPNEPIHLVGLSAGTAVLLDALDQLPENVQVNNVVLLSPSVSAERDLTRALSHMSGYLYATNSHEDYILAALAVNADGGPGSPAGKAGFRRPAGASPQMARLYEKVINLPWKPGYAGYGWNGGHTHVTDPRFVRSVVAPRLLAEQPLPIDRPLLSRSTKNW